jgi:8-oxo-dGTP diphosphatase
VPRTRRSVAGIAVDAGRLFVARRKAGGDLGGKWEFPGGKVEEDESDEAALRREYQEELGLAIETGPRIAASSFEHGGAVFSLNAYRVFFRDDNLNDHIRLTEHTGWRWAALDEIERMDFADSDRGLLPALEVYFKHDPGVHD